VHAQTYDILTGQGYVDIKNGLLMDRLSQKSLHKVGSGSILGLGSTHKLNLNVDIGDEKAS